MPKRPRDWVLLLAASLLAFSVHAAQGEGWGIEQLMDELAQVKRSQARFTERKYLKVLKSPLLSSGTLTYTAPDKLEKRTLKPKPEALLVDGDTLDVEMAGGRKHTLKMQDYPVLWAFVESIRATLGGDVATLRRFYKIDLDGGREHWQLYLAPRERNMSQVISQIRIAGAGRRIELIEVQETRGDRSVMQVVEAAP